MTTVAAMHMAFSNSLEWPEDMEGVSLTMTDKRYYPLKHYVDRLPEEDILDAIEITAAAAARKPELRQTFTWEGNTPSVQGVERRWRYFIAVCRNKLAAYEEEERVAKGLDVSECQSLRKSA